MRRSESNSRGRLGYFRKQSSVNEATLKMGLLLTLALLFVSSSVLVIILNYSDSTETNAVANVVIEREPLLELVDVLVPTQEIPAGSLLEPSMFRAASRPKAGLSDQVIKDYEEIRGMYAKSLIVQEQPFSTAYISNVRPVNIITASIPEGYRAVTIQVDVKTGIEGWARAGARVDVTWITSLRGKQSVTVIVENAKIISAARKTENDSQAEVLPTELTLLVPIEDARKILLAQQAGTLSLSLRGDNDSGKSSPGGTFSVDDLLGGPISASEKRNEPIVKIRDSSGQYEEFILRSGKLIPLSEAGNGGNSPLSLGNG